MRVGWGDDMLVAVMADSHDNKNALSSAMAICRVAGVSAIIHCGDIVAPFSLRLLTSSGIPVHAVYGNNDGERRMLQKELPTIVSPPLRIRIARREIYIYHALPDKIPATDILFYGHTHKKDLRIEGGTLILNPGELGGWVGGKSSFAFVDLRTFEVRWIDF